MSKSPSPMDNEVKLLHKLEVFQIQGQDRQGRRILTIVAKFFPGGVVSSEGLKKYLEEKIFPELRKTAWSMVYIHTGVESGHNFPAVSILRSTYNALPLNIKHNLEAIYFIHPHLYHRLFFATFGRFLFIPGLYWKLKYVDRLEFLWEYVRMKEMEIPEFVYDHEEELDYRPMVDLGVVTRHH